MECRGSEEGTARWEAIRGAMDMYICNAYIYNIQLDIYTYTDMHVCNAYIYNIQLDIYTYVYTPTYTRQKKGGSSFFKS